MKLLAMDPAGKKFGIAGISITDDGQLDLYLSFLLESPSSFDATQRSRYMSHAAAAIVGIDKPDVLVSEKPFGMSGWGGQAIAELLGSMKAEIWQSIKWYGVSESRRAVLGDSWGGATKGQSADWLLQYPWTLKSKRIITEQMSNANPDTNDGYDILDAIMHGVCYLISNNLTTKVTKPPKEKKRGSKIKNT